MIEEAYRKFPGGVTHIMATDMDIIQDILLQAANLNSIILKMKADYRHAYVMDLSSGFYVTLSTSRINLFSY